MITNFQNNLKSKSEILSLTSILVSLFILLHLCGNFIPCNGPGRTGQAAQPLMLGFEVPFIVRLQFRLVRKSSKNLYLAFQPNIILSSLLQWIQEFRNLAFHHSNFTCLWHRVPYFWFSLRFSHPSIFLVIYIWNCFNLLLSSSNRELITKSTDF